MEKTRTIEIQGKLARASCLPNGRRAHAHRLVKPKPEAALVRTLAGRGPACACQLAWGPPGGETLEDAAEPREHGEAAVLGSLIFGSSRSPDSARPRSKRPPGDTSPTVSSSKAGSASRCGTPRRGRRGRPRWRGRPRRRGSRSPRGRGADSAGELVRDRGAVVGGAQGARSEPRVPAVSAGAGHAEHRPAAVDHLTLGVLLEPKGMMGTRHRRGRCRTRGRCRP